MFLKSLIPAFLIDTNFTFLLDLEFKKKSYLENNSGEVLIVLKLMQKIQSQK